MNTSNARPAPDRQEVERELTEMWAQVLGVPAHRVRHTDSFFARGDSLLVTELMDRVNRRFFADRPDSALPITAYFTHTSIAEIARLLAGEPVAAAAPSRPEPRPAATGGVAVIGMSGRFPGAPNVAQFWRNVCSGVQSIRDLSGDELAGEPCANEPNYVRRGAPLAALDLFDAEYFGLTPREAALTCPEQRLMLECAVEALEDAGHGARRGEEVGVFIGASDSPFVQRALGTEACFSHGDAIRLRVANTSAATRISYLLDLKGPSFSVDTACSSSMVAVHQARRALQNRECDMAIAGGVSTLPLSPRGYWYEEGGILSRDGSCRPFDRDASGTVFTSGAALVVLKRLDDAIADRDTIYAVIRATAVNNDGNAKVGYAAPAAAGQTRVIQAALAEAQMAPHTIEYVETHGTGTRIGDRIEIESLLQAFGGLAGGGACCELGALKANIGHVEAASGAAGLIKAALMLRHRTLPPAASFAAAAPGIDLERSGFRMGTSLRDWTSTGMPRRAGVSSFGIGGTNAHALLEEGPPSRASDETCEPQLLIVSGKSRAALTAACAELAAFMGGPDAPSLADIAYTLQVGRTGHPWRRAVVCTTHAEAATALAEGDGGRPCATGVAPDRRSVEFVFRQLADTHIAALATLCRQEPRFRAALEPHAWLIGAGPGHPIFDSQCGHARSINAPGAAPPPVQRNARLGVLLQLALASLWRSWGVTPSSVSGAGTGAFAAAAFAGALGIDDALRLLAAWNRNDVAPAFANELSRVAFAVPHTPLACGKTSLAPSAGSLREAAYWTELFANADERPADSGPSREGAGGLALTMDVEDRPRLLEALGRSWEAGAAVDWVAFNTSNTRTRVRLPTYPFQRRWYWPPELGLPGAGREPRRDASVAAAVGAAGPEAVKQPIGADRAELERELMRIWSELLGMHAFTVADDFFQLGGDSLLAVQLRTRIGASFGLDIPLRTLIASPTIAQIADLVGTRAAPLTAHATAARTGAQ